jgi:hypothetical protein
MTRVPMSTETPIAARPSEDVAPRMTIVWPGESARPQHYQTDGAGQKSGPAGDARDDTGRIGASTGAPAAPRDLPNAHDPSNWGVRSAGAALFRTPWIETPELGLIRSPILTLGRLWVANGNPRPRRIERRAATLLISSQSPHRSMIRPVHPGASALGGHPFLKVKHI